MHGQGTSKVFIHRARHELIVIGLEATVNGNILRIQFEDGFHFDLQGFVCEPPRLYQPNHSLIYALNMHLKQIKSSKTELSQYLSQHPRTDGIDGLRNSLTSKRGDCKTCASLVDKYGKELHGRELHIMELAILFLLIARSETARPFELYNTDLLQNQKEAVRGLLHRCHQTPEEVLIFNRFDLLDHIHHYHKGYYQAWLKCSLRHHQTHHSQHAEQSAMNELRVAVGSAPNHEEFMTLM